MIVPHKKRVLLKERKQATATNTNWMENFNVQNDPNIKNVPELNPSRKFGAKIANQTTKAAN